MKVRTDDRMPEMRGKILEFRGSRSINCTIMYDVKREQEKLENLLWNRGPLPCRTDYGIDD